MHYTELEKFGEKLQKELFGLVAGTSFYVTVSGENLLIYYDYSIDYDYDDIVDGFTRILIDKVCFKNLPREVYDRVRIINSNDEDYHYIDEYEYEY